MAVPPRFSLFQQRFITGDNRLLRLDDEFLRRHTKVLLRSDTSERIWKVKLDGGKLADGWEEFAGVNKFRDGDVLVFRHDGDENFHVSRSSSGDLEHTSPSNNVDSEDGYIDDDDFESDDDDDYDDDDAGNITGKKAEAGSSSGHSCLVEACVTRYSLLKDRLDLSRSFTVLFGESKKTREIDLVNEQGRRWTLVIAKNCSSNVFYIRRGWTSFCSTNGLNQGDLCQFKLFENGEKPMLCLCSQESGKEKNISNEASKGKKKKNTPSPFLTVKLTPSRYKNGQLYISSSFATENGINYKLGELTLVNKDGRRKWSSNLQMTGSERNGSEWYYLRRGWKDMCEANGVNINDSFVLELIWEDANPIFKFHSKFENHEKKDKENRKARTKRACETDLRARTVEKTPRVEIEGGTRVSYTPTSTTNSRKSCAVSSQVTNVKQSIVDTLNFVRQFRAELKKKERNLEASILEIDALGESIWGINQILNNTLV